MYPKPNKVAANGKCCDPRGIKSNPSIPLSGETLWGGLADDRIIKVGVVREITIRIWKKRMGGYSSSSFGSP